jgi:hypothetical protein
VTGYPMLHLLLRWGRPIAVVLACLAVAAALWAAWSSGNILWGLLGVGVAAVGYCLLLSYVELVRLITDMLLPK